MKFISKILLLGIMSGNAVAQNNNIDMKVSANVQSGCLLNMPDAHLPAKTITKNIPSNSEDIENYDYQFTVHCSKGFETVVIKLNHKMFNKGSKKANIE